MSAPAPTAVTLEPFFLALGSVALAAYARGARGRAAPWWRMALFGLGLLLVVGALNSPLETIAVDYLLLIHLLQNVMIADWAAPLLLLGLTAEMRVALARRFPRVLVALTRPKVALPAWLVGWYGIHLALVYDYALRHAWALNVEHLLLLVLGLLFWWPVLSDAPHALEPALAAGYLGAAFVGSVFLGLGLTFSPTPFYDYYVDAPRLWGLSSAEDQNLGGVLMSGEQAVIFLVAIAYFVSRLIPQEETS
ncbi:MAG: cytochrome c oxidase assembly protein [Actinomycetota bacterium]|nr:cytochrome c oxidase assembly protein [Actinomycetota bacterium]